MIKVTKWISLIVSLLITISIFLPAYAAEQPTPADKTLVSRLLPNYQLINGNIYNNHMRLLMTRPDGALVFVGCVQDASGHWSITESTPLPEGTILGVENFVYSLGIPGNGYYHAIDVAPYPDGSWGVSLIHLYGHDDLIVLGKNWILSEHQSTRPIHGHFGDHPWSDLSTIDWNTLPESSYEEAIAQLDTTNWAVVHNPDPKDRLHLRTKANRNATSLGKYYNRTLVRVLQHGNEWTKVSIGNIEGWMMTQYLAFGHDMQSVDYAGPWLIAASDQIPLYTQAHQDAFYRQMNADESPFVVIGIVSDTWFHVWFPSTNEYFYVLQDDLWEGNG